MTKQKNILFVFLLVQLFAFIHVKGQSLNEIINKNLTDNDITNQLPTLKQLQDSAVKHSPLLKIFDSDLVIQQLKIKSEKREWMRSLGLEAGAKYGLLGN